MAAKIRPLILDKMFKPVVPSRFSNQFDKISINPKANIAVAMPKKPIKVSNRVGNSAPSTNIVPMVAGPTIIGIASGTTEISSRCSLGSPFACKRVPLFTKLTAVKNKSAPAPIRNESKVMPIKLNNNGPAKNKTAPIAVAAKHALTAVCRFDASVSPWVMTKNIDTTKNGANRKIKRIALVV